MLDRYWYGTVDRISPEAPVPVVRVTHQEERVGAAANVAYNVATLGAKTTLLAIVGDDEASHQLQSLVEKTGVTPHFERDPQLKTTVKLRVIGRQQQLLRLDFENVPGQNILACLANDFEKLHTEHDAVLFSDYDKGGLSKVTSMIAQARSSGKHVFVDPKGANYDRYQNASVITPNRAELEQVIGTWKDEAELRTKAQNLRTELNLDAVLLTRSEDGMSLFDAQGDFHVPTVAREVFDVTGAGDTVIATLAALVAAGMNLRDAIVVSNRAAGIVVGKFGTAAVTYEDLFKGI